MDARGRVFGAVTAALVAAVTVGAGVAPPAQATHAGRLRTGAAPPPRITPPAADPRGTAAGAVAPVGGRVVRSFAAPATPYGPGHRGVDLAGRPGEVVRASLAGTVTFAGRVAGTTWVTVAHGAGLVTTYGGFTATVREGDRVALGARLGAVGQRGLLDWGARRAGRYVDPLGLLGGWRVVLVPVR